MVDDSNLPSTTLLCSQCKMKVASFSDASVQCQLAIDPSQDSQRTYETNISTKVGDEFKKSSVVEHHPDSSGKSPSRAKDDDGSDGSNTSMRTVSEHEEVSPEASICAPAVTEKEEVKEEIAFVSRSFENAEPATKAAKKWRWGVSKILRSKKKGSGSNVSTPSPSLRGGVRRKSLTAVAQEDKERLEEDSSRKTSLTRSPALPVSASLKHEEVVSTIGDVDSVKSPFISKVEDAQEGMRSDVYEEIIIHSKRKSSNESGNLKVTLEKEQTEEEEKLAETKLSVKSETAESEGKESITVPNQQNDSQDIDISQDFDKEIHNNEEDEISKVKESSSLEAKQSDQMPENNKAKDNFDEKDKDSNSSEDDEESGFIKKVTESFASIFKREDSDSSTGTSSGKSGRKEGKKKRKEEKPPESGDDDKIRKTDVKAEGTLKVKEKENSERAKKKKKKRKESLESKGSQQASRSANEREGNSDRDSGKEERNEDGKIGDVLHQEELDHVKVGGLDKQGNMDGDFQLKIQTENYQSGNEKAQDEVEGTFENSSKLKTKNEEMDEEDNTRQIEKEREGKELPTGFSLFARREEELSTVEKQTLNQDLSKSFRCKVTEESYNISVSDNKDFSAHSNPIYAQVQKKKKSKVDETIAKGPPPSIDFPPLENQVMEKHSGSFSGHESSLHHGKRNRISSLSQITNFKAESKKTEREVELVKSEEKMYETDKVRVYQKDNTLDQNYHSFNWKENKTLPGESSLAPSTRLCTSPVNGIKDVKIVSVVHEKSPQKTTALSESFSQLKNQDNSVELNEISATDLSSENNRDQITRAIASLRQKRNLKKQDKTNVRMVKGKGKLRPIKNEEKEKDSTVTTEVENSEIILETSEQSEHQGCELVPTSSFKSKKARLREVRIGVTGGTPNTSRKDGYDEPSLSKTTDEESGKDASRSSGFALRFFTQRHSPSNSIVDDESLTSIGRDSAVGGRGVDEPENLKVGKDKQGFLVGEELKRYCRDHKVKTEECNSVISNGKNLAASDDQVRINKQTNSKTIHIDKDFFKVSEYNEDINFEHQNGEDANKYRGVHDTYKSSGQLKPFDKFLDDHLRSNETQFKDRGIENSLEDSSLSGLEDEEWALKGTTFLEILKAIQEEDKEDMIRKEPSESTFKFTQRSKYDCKSQQTLNRRVLPINEGVTQNNKGRIVTSVQREMQSQVVSDKSNSEYNHKQGKLSSCAGSVSSTDEYMRKDKYQHVYGKAKAVTWSDRLQETESDSSEAPFDLSFVQRLKQYKMRKRNDQEKARLTVQKAPSIDTESGSTSTGTIVYLPLEQVHHVSPRQSDVIPDDSSISSTLDEDEVQMQTRDMDKIAKREVMQIQCSKEKNFLERLRQAKEENRDIASQIHKLRSKSIQREKIAAKSRSSSEQDSTSTLVKTPSPDFKYQNGRDEEVLVAKQRSHSWKKQVPTFIRAKRLEQHSSSSEQVRYSKLKSSHVENDSETAQELESTMDATYHDDIMEHLTLQSSKLVNGTRMKATKSHDSQRMNISVKKPNEKEKILLNEGNTKRKSNLEEKDGKHALKTKSKGFKLTSLYVH